MNDNKSAMLKTVGVIILLVLLGTISFFASSSSTSKTSSDNNSNNGDITSQASKESEAIKDNEKREFNDIDVSVFIDLYNDGENSVVLLSRPTCGYCRVAEPILQNISYKYDFEINHVNTDQMSEEDFENLKSINDRFESFGTPLLLVVSNGKIVDEVSGLTTTSRYVDFFKKHQFISE